ncbi:LacI family DNA-binding transcriptional regulator [Edaphobacter albus]|uniref:LacI family DNA-binding transcriptional regulator n=1 Tax=Edaphobacter sp. 4G125 TaxID=2763071 RepID=UPI001647B104|nr:LacI family DNA-binding transcriptional regulator [Edaphobacter sp. 4G125]QNI38194.1 LacI family DNA-binding transcriptional regulator [Edaphobacter sp. 4G125]
MNIRQVAKAAGVSSATVSRVFTRSAPVDPQTEHRVHKAAKQLGYFPNTYARILSSGKSYTYGLIISDITNPFFPDLVKLFERHALEYDYETLVVDTDYDLKRMEQCVRRLLEHKVDGVAIMTSEMEPKLIQILSRRDIPLVFLDTGKVGRNISNITIDYEHGIALAIDHLLQLGHERIALIQGPPTLKSAVTRRNAFISSLKRQNITLRREYIRTGNHGVDGGQAAMNELLDLPSPPTAVMCSNDLTAIGALDAAYTRGVQVPSELSLIGFDDIQLSGLMQPPLTTIRVSRVEIALRAFMALYDAIPGSRKRTANHIIATELIARRSTAPPPKPSGESQSTKHTVGVRSAQNKN